jgi:hypothetical protein
VSDAATTLLLRAEVLKLARLLERDPESLAYLERLTPAQVHELRQRITDRLFDASAGPLRSLAAASRLLPVGVAAAIGQRVFGALLSARLTATLDPARAAQMAAHMDDGFVADVAAELDPRRAHELIARIPVVRVAAITAELTRRRDYVAMGRFVGHLSDAAVSAATARMDDQALLEVAFVLEDPDELGRIVALLPARRVPGVVAAAVDHGLWPQAELLLEHLPPGQRARFLDELRRTAGPDAAALVARFAGTGGTRSRA